VNANKWVKNVDNIANVQIAKTCSDLIVISINELFYNWLSTCMVADR